MVNKTYCINHVILWHSSSILSCNLLLSCIGGVGSCCGSKCNCSSSGSTFKWLGLGTENHTTAATRTKTQRTFRCFLSVPEPIEIEKNYYFELLCQRVTIAYHWTLKAEACTVCVCVSPEHITGQAERDGETVPLNTWRPMMTRAAWTQISTVTLIASLAFIKIGPQILN